MSQQQTKYNRNTDIGMEKTSNSNLTRSLNFLYKVIYLFS